MLVANTAISSSSVSWSPTVMPGMEDSSTIPLSDSTATSTESGSWLMKSRTRSHSCLLWPRVSRFEISSQEGMKMLLGERNQLESTSVPSMNTGIRKRAISSRMNWVLIFTGSRPLGAGC